MDTLASIVVSENHRGPVTCISYARGVSDRFATASVDGTVRVWDTADYGVLTTAVVRDAGEPLCLVLTQVSFHACTGTKKEGPINWCHSPTDRSEQFVHKLLRWESPVVGIVKGGLHGNLQQDRYGTFAWSRSFRVCEEKILRGQAFVECLMRC